MSILKYFPPTKEKLELTDFYGSLIGRMPLSAASSANAKVKDVLEKRVLAVKALSDTYTCPEVSNWKASSRMWYNGNNLILPEEISRLSLKETTVRQLKYLYQSGLKFKYHNIRGHLVLKLLMKYVNVRQVDHCLFVNLISRFNNI